MNKSPHLPRKLQGSIISFMKKQDSKRLLRDKNGLKQGKIDIFLKPKQFQLSSQCLKRNQEDCMDRDMKRKKCVSSSKPKPTGKKIKPLNCVETTLDIPIECIEVCDDSGSDEYFTGPSTQASEADEYATAASCIPINELDDVILGSPCLSDKVSPRPCQKKEVDILENINMNDDLTAHGCEIDDKNLEKVDNVVRQSTPHDDCTSPFPTLHSSTAVETDNPSTCISMLDDDVIKQLLEEDSDDSNKSSQSQKVTPIRCDNSGTSSLPSSNPLHHHRHEVISVLERFDDQGCLTKLVHLKNKATLAYRKLVLSDDWADCHIEEGDIVNLIQDTNPFPSAGDATLKITSKENLLVLHPDQLVSGTTVSNAFGCVRRAVLSERFKNTELGDSDNISNVMLVGTIVHEIFQSALKRDKPIKYEELKKMAHDIVYSRRYFSDMISVCSSQVEIFKEVEPYLPRIETWISEYNRSRTTVGRGVISMQHCDLQSANLNGKTLKYPASVAMTQVVDIEENVWSPRFGMKGKIDVTGRFKVRRKNGNEEFSTIMPVEVKTGRESHSMEHHIQVAIYSMFCNERRNVTSAISIPAGLLLYLKTGVTSCNPLKRVDKCGIITIRNQIAHFMTKDVVSTPENDVSMNHAAPFPPTISNNRICGRCSQLRNCALVYKSVDERQPSFHTTDELKGMMSQHYLHLSNDDLAYFEHWMTCTLLECKAAARQNKQLRLWLDTPKVRSSEGRCLTGMRLAGAAVKSHHGGILQTLKRSDDPDSNKGVFEEGETVLISGAEPQFIAMATGRIDKITNRFVTVEIDRDLSCYEEGMVYSIDKHVWLSQISVQSSLSNLSILMDNNHQCNRLRELIVGHRDPTFRKSLDFLPRTSKDAIASMLRGLNRTQRQAIKRVLLSNDYTLVVGMPGSGKTTTIVSMIRILLLCGLRVLVTSYTHSAVDNLLAKLIKYKVPFLRLGNPARVHSSVQPFTEEYLSRDFKQTDQLKDLYDSARVVGCTCLAVTSHVFFAMPGHARPLFDVCIVDEASQITQPACLAPLVHANRFVLVGDHKQLPPLVVSHEAKSMGADESLFWRLTSHVSALCELTLQYRMNSDIMGLSNHLTYEGRLECAHPSVALATVVLDRFEAVKQNIDPCSDWLIRTLDPRTSVAFLDTSKIKFVEDQLVVNETEAGLVSKVTGYIIEAGCRSNDIGIIAPFRKQVQFLEEMITKVAPPGVEVNTVDKYQGRDKSVVIVSFVRTGKRREEKKGELLSDWRRLNVAITRAKHKLVMVGCTRTLMQYPPCKKLIDYLIINDMVMSV